MVNVFLPQQPNEKRNLTALNLVEITWLVVKQKKSFFTALFGVPLIYYWAIAFVASLELENLAYLVPILITPIVYLWWLGSQIVSLNHWLERCRLHDNPPAKNQIFFRPRWALFYCLLIWICLSATLEFARELRYHPTFGAVGHGAFWALWLLSFKAYFFIPAAALKEPLGDAWRLSDRRYIEVFFSSLIISCVALILAFLPCVMLATYYPAYFRGREMADFMIFFLQLAAIAHFSVMYCCFKNQGFANESGHEHAGPNEKPDE